MNRKVKILSRRVVFRKGPITLTDSVVKMPDGSTHSRQILEHPGAVVIIPKIGKDKYILIRQYRFAAKNWLYEFPAGGIEKGENLAAAAKRELTEETGYKPLKLSKAVDFFPTPGIAPSPRNPGPARQAYLRFRRMKKNGRIKTFLADQKNCFPENGRKNRRPIVINNHFIDMRVIF